MAAVNKVREELAQAFLAALKEEQLPWRACWAQGRPYNAATGRRYKGINTLRLSMLADERGYKDPRWCTFQQAKDKGWKIRKGEHATKVEYWAMYDMERKRWMNWNEVERLKRDDPDAADKLQLRSRTALVFNAAQMEGVPPLPQRPGQTLVNSASSGTPCWRICSWPIGRKAPVPTTPPQPIW